MVFSLIHNTLAFCAGSAIVYVGYIYQNERVVITQRQISNRVRNVLVNEENRDSIQDMPTSVDHYEEASNAFARTWNHGVLSLHHFVSSFLLSDKPFSETLKDQWQSIKSIDVKDEANRVKASTSKCKAKVSESLQSVTGIFHKKSAAEAPSQPPSEERKTE